ncbi:MAG: type II toxin-antitoxin system RelE family toxin [Dehalococcoidia bacterium]
MAYSITFLRRAQKELDRLPKREGARILDAIRLLAEMPRPAGSRRLRDREGRRIRVGAYRVIYSVDDTQRKVVILEVGHRRDVYR